MQIEKSMKLLATSQMQSRLIKTIKIIICKARSAISGRGLPLDVHGSTDQEQRAEPLKGYLVHSKHRDSENYSKNITSIRSFGRHWCGDNNECFKNFIFGNRSLGLFMNLDGLHAVPSPENKEETRKHSASSVQCDLVRLSPVHMNTIGNTESAFCITKVG